MWWQPGIGHHDCAKQRRSSQLLNARRLHQPCGREARYQNTQHGTEGEDSRRIGLLRRILAGCGGMGCAEEEREPQCARRGRGNGREQNGQPVDIPQNVNDLPISFWGIAAPGWLAARFDRIDAICGPGSGGRRRQWARGACVSSCPPGASGRGVRGHDIHDPGDPERICQHPVKGRPLRRRQRRDHGRALRELLP